MNYPLVLQEGWEDESNVLFKRFCSGLHRNPSMLHSPETGVNIPVTTHPGPLTEGEELSCVPLLLPRSLDAKSLKASKREAKAVEWWVTGPVLPH